ncbi:MAG: hypothetical protein UT58_C0001G0031 [Microgenomates group bacterium GW2011_GWC1_39_7b]|uniref:Glycosyltransferase RgtA/B/C/D-like domain-containing protein n=3 Tax=Candidatus Woeseibacteriota TaxID=1752722 RepID=A0A0G0P181_9BACT|nr:MAG: hypothetical protein UT17_C0004G0202 [Candidatus Woesebacteria bacterium GW2011_GWB1_39_10]KKR27053.1 MAG: hypothetical protein UT58_C0001G0031 [Microgenomates group bacterium GW2011_GWC1_39_7b]KKR71599.1 MAG: hypothetical protein UU16_C0058G0006 [Candidatus Woesebacteria bacterium GW2011_GWA2_40_7]KKS90844.1 MAG: hypothetical protein UV66_C0001G0201 [Candidatus Woesebacteria bacterium GW2011_GWA1_43_12]
MQKVEKFLVKYPFLIILLLSIPAVWALFVPGYFGASDDLHIGWLFEMNRSLSLGQFPPRFVPDLSFGFGYPLFNFVFPLPFYIGEIFHKLGLSLVDSVKAIFLMSVPLSMYFMYKFIKEYTNEFLALAGAVLYVYTPYRATDIYVRGAIGEILAFVFPPLIAFSITKIGKEKSIKWICLLSLGVAGLILSHDIMAYMFIPFLALFALVQWKGILRSIYGFILGLLVSLYFWLPALIESKLMKYGTGNFNFIDHFPTLKQLVTPHFGYGASVPGPHDGMSFFMGAINVLLVVATVVLIRKGKPIIYWALFTIAVSVFLMNFRSTFLWKIIPYLPYFQFPWRFLSLTTFATSVLVISFDKFKLAKTIGIVVVLTAVALNFTNYKPHDFLGRTDAYYLNRYIPFPSASAEYLKTQEEYLRLPQKTQMRPDKLSPDQGLGATFKVNYAKETIFDYSKYYFPGWIVTVDGKKVDVYAGEPYGQLEFKVPAGEHELKIAFKETRFRKVLDIISLLSVLGAITILVRRNK